MKHDTFRADTVCVVGMLLFLVAFFGILEFASPLFFLNDDNCTFFLPAYVHNYRTLAETGQLAHVNYHQFMGVPHLGSAQPATLYPPIYLAVWTAQNVLGDVRMTIDLLAISHLLLASLSMYGLARYLKFVPLHAALLGISWATLPFNVVVTRAWLFVSYLAAYLPLNLWMLLRLLQEPRALSRMIPLVIVKTTFIATGYLQYLVLGSLFEGIFVLTRWGWTPSARQTRWRELGAYVAVAVLTFGWSAPVLLPALQAKELSKYREAPLSTETILGNSMQWNNFVRAQFLWPDSDAIFLTSGAIFFIGLPVIAAVIWLLMQGPAGKLEVGWTCALVGVAAVALSTPLYRIVCVSRLMASFRWPFKGFAFAAFFLTVAAGFVWMRWRESEHRWRTWSDMILALTIACQMFLFAWPANRAPFASYQLPCPVEKLKQTAAYQRATGLERTATFAGEPTHDSAFAAYRDGHWMMGFSYATLAGTYQLGGYDPIVPWRQADLVRGVNQSSQFYEPITPELIQSLSNCSVRWLVAPSESPNARLLSRQAGVERVVDDGRVTLFQLKECAPLAYWQAEGPSSPVSVSVDGNALRFATNGQTGSLLVNFAYHPAYQYFADGKPLGVVQETDSHRMACNVPPDTRQLTIRFRDKRFQQGMGLAAITLLVSVMVVIVGRNKQLRN